MARKKAAPSRRPTGKADRANRAVQKAARALGDLAVAQATLSRYAETCSAKEAAALLHALAPLRARLERRARATGSARALEHVDLDEVTRLAALGLKPTQIARIMRLQHQVLLGPAHEEEVREAIADGEALFAAKHLANAEEMALGRKRWNPVAIFTLKQAGIGWSDRVSGQGTGADGAIPIEVDGALERMVEAVAAWQKAATEGKVDAK